MKQRYMKRELTEQDKEELRIHLAHNEVKLSPEPSCDFCGSDKPKFIYLAHQMSTGHKQEAWRWCACEKCQTAVDLNDWNTIRLRSRRRVMQLAELNGIKLNQKQVEKGIDAAVSEFKQSAQVELVADEIPPLYGVQHNLASTYVAAMEARLKWLRWCMEGNAYRDLRIDGVDEIGYSSDPNRVLPMYEQVLRAGDTFYMNQKFCSLVDHARETIPDDLAFEMDWLQSKQGWMWIADPFEVPQLDADAIGAADKTLSPIEITTMNVVPNLISAVGWGINHEAHAVEIMCFQDLDLFRRVASRKIMGIEYLPQPGFNTWSFFGIRDGDKLGEAIERFERNTTERNVGKYKSGRTTDMHHEMRWVYAAFYLMAQRLATNVRQDANRATRKLMEREKAAQQIPPFIRIITLRKLEAARKEQEKTASEPVDWQWQWEVRGHWRNQWYPSENIHKPKFIEAYIKGPNDKPLKPVGHKLFVAQR